MSTTFPAISDPETHTEDRRRGASLPALFAEIVAHHGERTAITLDGKSITYYELDRISNRIACALIERGARPGAIVAICLERSIDMIAAMLGVVKSGAAYLPLDPGYPVARLVETVADAHPVTLITTRGLAERLSHLSASIPFLYIGDINQSGAAAPPQVEVSDEEAAYVIYTSGSTGRPKGVVVTHRNVARLLSGTDRWFRFTPNDVWTMFHSFAFDFSVWEIWGALLTGARLVIVPFGVSRSPEDFHALLVHERVTVVNQTPSAFVLLDQVDATMPLARLSLRLVIFGGEALSPATLRGWFERHGDAKPQLVNMYGITETTVHVTYRRMLAADAHRERESLIGEPIPDLLIHLLDQHLRPVRDGREGELCVGGAGVARGYLNRPTLTAERFCDDPFATEAGAKLYRSGDLARRREDGELVYLGRRDSQVKINGFRIELGEIETAMVTHPAVVQACVVAHSQAGAAPRLAAYFVAQYGMETPTRELSDFLAARLPAQMMPAFYQRLAVFPLTPNGKVDRTALPAPTAGTALHPLPQTTSTTLEDLVAGIWRHVLKADSVSLDDNFFDVGGTSLLLIAVRTGLQEQLERPIPVTWMFECTTIRALARRLGDSTEPSTQAPELLHDRTLQTRVQKQRLAFARARAQRSVTQ